MQNYEHIHRNWRQVHDNLHRRGKIPDAQKRKTNDWLNQHRNILAVAERSDGYEEFVLAYIQREQARNTAATEGVSRRERPVCTCEPFNCPLKEGRLPREIREAQSVDDGIQEFRTRPFHQGDPVVLTEAQKAYSELMVAVDEILREATVILSGDVEPPEEPVRLSEQTRDALDLERVGTGTDEAAA